MNIVIIGSGTAGVTLAKRLLNFSEKAHVTIIEVGDTIEQLNQRIWVDYVSDPKKNDPYSDYKELPDDQVNLEESVDLDLPGSRYFGLGGSTNVWGGWCIRYKQEDFFLNSNTGYGADWPYDLSTLEPFYRKAEETLWVAGNSKPNPPIPYTLKDGEVISALESLGLKYEPLPLARKESCLTIGTCKYCPIGKRYAPFFDLRELQLSYPDRLNIVSMSFATRLKMKGKSKCSAVEIINHSSGETSSIECDQVVIAAGAIESPKLLLASSNSEWPTGIGNKYGHLGKHLTAHPLVQVVGVRSGNPDNYEQPVDFPTLACRAYDDESHQKTGKLFFVRDGRGNATNIENEWLDGHSLQSIQRVMRGRIPFELRGFVEVFSHPDNYIELDSAKSSFGGYKTKVSFQKSKETLKAIQDAETKMSKILEEMNCKSILPKTRTSIRADHATSTCRMSKKESDGVVDENLCVHGTENIFVCSNAVLPNGAAVNPTLTLVAVTEKLAVHLCT